MQLNRKVIEASYKLAVVVASRRPSLLLIVIVIVS